ncbi:hypothetical protein PR048_021578 [Dryococelus australis]|uniref:DDE-1 domain-containing protein n=1 Tax=Dryococelus australis TaxID=614101 RepID=A0ABQ9GYK9_9NEOP|nr:hypothetical protein PR048_021578 [Dryococelus australis]
MLFVAAMPSFPSSRHFLFMRVNACRKGYMIVLLQAVKLLVQIIAGEAFLHWLQFFVEHKGFRFCHENKVLFLSFAPHTTHKMQPLDIAVNGPLKLCFEQAICTFQKKTSWKDCKSLRVASAQNAISEFRSSGIWPYNSHIFSDVDYAPASVTDHPDPEYASNIRNGCSEN